MDNEGENKKLEKNFSRQSFSALFNVSIILQSFWIRCRSIFPTATDRQFMESELRFVLYSGFVFWAVYLVYEILK